MSTSVKEKIELIDPIISFLLLDVTKREVYCKVKNNLVWMREGIGEDISLTIKLEVEDGRYRK